MASIHLENIGKKYKREWVFRSLSLQLSSPKAYALTGHNGAGKSTLMRILTGHLSPSEGKIHFFHNDSPIEKDGAYKLISFASPYMDLIEEFTLTEALTFHKKFKPYIDNKNLEELLSIISLPKARNREIRYFSSGMKQRLKLLLAILSDTPILLLDEPGANLDKQGVEWYLQLIDQFAKDRLTIVASNVPEDFQFCTAQINIQDFK